MKRIAALVIFLTTGFLTAGPAMAGEHPILPDAWFQRDFETNLAQCEKRGRQPEWCQGWLDTLEIARPKLTDLTLPEWRRVPFADNMKVCTTLLSPDWCPEWRTAMKQLSLEPAYRTRADALSNERTKAEDERDTKIQVWKDAITHIGQGKPTPVDMALLQQHITDGDATAMELLGWMHASGQGVKRDYVLAYEAYGRAVLAGREDLRPLLEPLWKQLNETQKNEINAFFKALAAPPAAPR